MATPAQLRDDTGDVVTEASLAYGTLVAGVDNADLSDLLMAELPGLIQAYAEAAATIAVEWYDEARLDAGAPSSFSADIAALPDPGVNGLIGWARDHADSFNATVSLIEQGVAKRVANGSRLTIGENAARDPQARGLQRYARSATGSCAFCQMLAGRGTVYRSLESAAFSAHDNCRCVVVAAFKGSPTPVRPYVPTSSNITDADRARVREWLRNH